MIPAEAGYNSNYDAQKRKSQQQKSAVVGNRIPPHSEEAEEAVLGAMMISKTAIPKVIEDLKSDAFYNNRNKIIYETALQIWNENIPVDMLTLTDALVKNGTLSSVGGTPYLAELSKAVPSAANIEEYSRIVQEQYLKRMLLEKAEMIVSHCFDPTIDAIDEIDEAEQAIFQISEKRFLRSYSSLHDLTLNVMGTIESLRSRDTGGITGVGTGYPELDRYLGGFQKSDLIIIAARPSMENSAFAFDCTKCCSCKADSCCLFFCGNVSAAVGSAFDKLRGKS